jgi:hypothetical protein
MSCSAGVCAPTVTDAMLNVTDLENLLASGNVSVVTTNERQRSGEQYRRYRNRSVLVERREHGYT